MTQQQLTDVERQLLLRLIDMQLSTISGRVAGADYTPLVSIRRKLEGVDKRIMIEQG